MSGPPFAYAARKLGPQKQLELLRQLDYMLDNDIIEFSCSQYTNPVHLVPKKEPNSFRFCVDYRKLNAITDNQSFTLPRISDVTHRLHGACVFSTLDLKNAYWQINVRPCDRKFTAFSCPYGTFQFKRMPMGTKNSAFTFQRAISYILHGLEHCTFAYIDDELVFSENLDEHKRHLHQILHRLNAYGLSLNITKSLFAVSEVQFLGHKINQDGIHILQSRVETIERLPLLTSIRELRRALGLINFQRRFIKDAAGILAPLTKHLQGHVKNQVKINLDENAKQTFAKIKKKLAESTGLAHPRADAKLRLYTDASTQAIGGVLVQQLPDSSEQALAYFSRALNDTQQRYSIFDLELLATFSAVKHFEHFLLDQHFTIITDYLSLVRAFNKPSLSHSPRQSRQLSYLTEFDCDIIHIPGSQNNSADCLSKILVHNIFEEQNINISLQDIANAQEEALAENPLIFQFPDSSTIQVERVDVCSKYGKCSLLVDTSQGVQRILIPSRYETDIIDHYHNLNHLGSEATVRFVTARFCFYNMKRKIRERVKACISCQRAKISRHIISPLTSCKMPPARLDTIHADLCGLFPECQGFSHLLVY